jgi:hypothetical protein
MPTAITFAPPDTTTWKIRDRMLSIAWNADFLAVSAFSALGLLLSLGLPQMS